MSNANQNGDFREKNTCMRQTTFGRSLESKAQIEDAAKIASGAEVGEILHVYRLVPVAPPFDALTIDSSNKMRTNADKKEAISAPTWSLFSCGILILCRTGTH
ncbi:hypothetical protein LCM4573_10740 [Rhizobium sp. LCM 4573]|nr:hypothetical protein LCM4573_10740 [Rhizobium sp. LCM 4573]